MSMEQVQFGDNPYLNTHNSGWQHHPYPSWETSQNALQPPQEHNTCLEEAMAELARSQVEFEGLRAEMEISQADISQPPQVQNSRLKEAMAKLARSQVEFASLRAEMENPQVAISQPPQVQKSPPKEAMNELANSQAEFANFQAQFMNETREILQI